MRWALSLACLVACSSLAWAPSLRAEEVRLINQTDGVDVRIGDQLFTKYVIKSGNKPILFPLVGPTGKQMTRGYPMRPATAEEKADHPHHRSFWFTHGEVNGVDFWAENPKSGTIKHREFVELKPGPTAKIVTRNDWIDVEGKKVCEDERTWVFGAADGIRWIDSDITVTASEGELHFGDTKEGSFGVRMAGGLAVDDKLGAKIVNAEGLADGAAWGKRSTWVDYYGPLEGETVGIAILNHPQSFNHPTPWHVRTYGLFTANPFGQKSFDSKAETSQFKIAKGEKLRLRHLTILHTGDEKTAKIAERYADYARGKLPQ